MAITFEETVQTYANETRAKYEVQVGAQDEDALKSLVGDLLRACGEIWDIETQWRPEARAEGDIGRPDLGVTAGGLLCGHVELKAPGRGARPERFRGRDREQWNRFQALPNLIYTDGSEWSLYRDGERIARVRIATDVSDEGAPGLDTEALPKLEGLFRSFLMHEPVTPSTARGLAEFLAPLARLLRDEVSEALDDNGSVVGQIADDWRGVLFGDAEADQFADAYAQTVTYALLLARFEGAESLRQAIAVDELRQSEHDLLAAALDLLERARDELVMPIELLERSIGAVDAHALLAGNGGQGAGDDPWLYFYEHFLASYDAKLRRNRGVYFTPVEVVRAQVRFAGELLREYFNKPLAFADDGVEVLDPASGTGTYPLAVLQHAAEATRDGHGLGAISGRIRNLSARLHAFEILVGPYAVAQLRLTQQLRELGVTDRGPLVYLTDTLESPNLQSQMGGVLYEDLTKERERARRVKRERRIFVCIGNPPYNREQREPNESGRRKGGWVRYGDETADAPPPLEDFLAPVREAGQGEHLKNVYNDYVYFWRWALWKVFDSSEHAGIVTFITASSYLRGPGFAGMRRKMREIFDDLWIIDLEGGSLGPRKTENVFAIQTPVAIAIGMRRARPDAENPARIRRVRLTGSEQEKLAALDAAKALDHFSWRECAPDWDVPFMPAGVGEYYAWPTVTDIFPWQQSGVKAGRTWPISPDREVLDRRWRDLVSADSRLRPSLFVERPTGRKVTDTPPALAATVGSDTPISMLAVDATRPTIEYFAYRAFDRQNILADSRVLDRPGPPLWRARSVKQIYMTSLLTEVVGQGAAAVATSDIPDLHHFRGSFGGKHVIPLYCDADAANPNVTVGLLSRIGETHGTPITAERLFAYAYAVLAQPTYVERFWDELEQPPPRLPITRDSKLFDRVADFGERLLHLHTYGERFVGLERPPGAVRGQARNTKAVGEALPDGHSYNPDERVLHVGEGEFAPVSPEVFNYSVSGFQVVKSWLVAIAQDLYQLIGLKPDHPQGVLVSV